jgi:hypothetical protein
MLYKLFYLAEHHQVYQVHLKVTPQQEGLVMIDSASINRSDGLNKLSFLCSHTRSEKCSGLVYSDTYLNTRRWSQTFLTKNNKRNLWFDTLWVWSKTPLWQVIWNTKWLMNMQTYPWTESLFEPSTVSSFSVNKKMLRQRPCYKRLLQHATQFLTQSDVI